MRWDHLPGREAPLLDLQRAARGPGRYFVHYVEHGKVDPFLRADEDLVLRRGHVATSCEFVGHGARVCLPGRGRLLSLASFSRLALQASLFYLFEGQQVLAESVHRRPPLLQAYVALTPLATCAVGEATRDGARGRALLRTGSPTTLVQTVQWHRPSVKRAIARVSPRVKYVLNSRYKLGKRRHEGTRGREVNGAYGGGQAGADRAGTYRATERAADNTAWRSIPLRLPAHGPVCPALRTAD